LNNASTIDGEKAQAIVSESLPLSEPSPLLPEGKLTNLILIIIIKIKLILFLKIHFNFYL